MLVKITLKVFNITRFNEIKNVNNFISFILILLLYKTFVRNVNNLWHYGQHICAHSIVGLLPPSLIRGERGGVGGGGVMFPLLHLVLQSFQLTSKILIQVFIVLKHCIICIFLIHSDTLHRILTALFKLVWNIQKVYIQLFFSVTRQDVS